MSHARGVLLAPGPAPEHHAEYAEELRAVVDERERMERVMYSLRQLADVCAALYGAGYSRRQVQQLCPHLARVEVED